MKAYECVFIVSTELSEEEQGELLNKFRDVVTSNGGEIAEEIVWGRRRLAYPINKKDFGHYVVWYIQGAGTTVDELHRQFGYNEHILRYQSIQVESIAEEVSYFMELLKRPTEEEEAAAAKEEKKEDAKESKEEATPAAEAEATEETKTEESAA
jgi:small subunit ribosomal protein S6